MIFDSGDTSKSIHVFIADDAGAPVTGLTYLTAPTISYWISGNNAAVPVTLADLAALTTAWTSGGFKEIGVGMYRFDIPNAALASAGKVLIYGGTSGKQMYPVTLDVGAVPTATAIATAVWNALTSGLTTSGSIGKRLVEFVTSLVYAAPLDADGTRTAIGLASANLDTQLGGISTKTDNLPASPASTTNITAGTITSVTNAVATSNASDVTAIKAKTDQLTFTVSNKVDATADVDTSSIATDVLTTQMTEDYAAEGAAPTLAQAIMLLLQREFNVSISGSTMTVKKLDGSTTAATLTLNSATEPTSITRTT